MKSFSFLLLFLLSLLLSLHHCKKGVRLDDGQSNCSDLDQLTVEWWWTGALSSRCTSKGDFVPTIKNITEIDKLSTLPPNTEWLLTFEDVNGDYPLDPKLVGSQWNKIASQASKVVSPSVSLNGKYMSYTTWLSSFFDSCGPNCQVTAIAVESNFNDIDELMSVLEHIHQKFQKPIWLVDISFNNTSGREALNLMKTLLPRLDSSAVVQRYAWSEVRSSASSPSSLYKSDLRSRLLTSLGKFFSSFKDGKGSSEDAIKFDVKDSATKNLGLGLERQIFSGMFLKHEFEDLDDINLGWSNGSVPFPRVSSFSGKDFSMIASGSLIVNVSGLYQFQTYASDGIRLWINHVIIVDDWTKQLTLSTSGSIILRAGVPAPIRIDFFHGNGSTGTCKLRWRIPGSSKTFVPVPKSLMSPDMPQDHPAEALVLRGPGVRREFFQDSKLSKSIADDVDNVDMSFIMSKLNGSFLISGVKVQSNQFSMAARGQLVAPYTGTYRFQIATSGGARLWIDENLVIDDWAIHMPALDSSRMFSFEVGDVISVRLEFFQERMANDNRETVDGFLHLKWAIPGDPTFHVIPKEAMFPYEDVLLSKNVRIQDKSSESRSTIIALAVVSAILVCGLIFAVLAAVYHFHVKKVTSYSHIRGE